MTAQTRLAAIVADYKDALAASDLSLQLDIKLRAYDHDQVHPDSPSALDAIRFIDRRSQSAHAQAAFAVRRPLTGCPIRRSRTCGEGSPGQPRPQGGNPREVQEREPREPREPVDLQALL
ncbi:hypothetical protein AB0F20_05685 [Streptomyces goshikiensis]|uniref:hypothetical protein n=1 Tax=Streptomyces goshikiensis TaxID=1942 RepID=UPI0033FA5FCC